MGEATFGKYRLIAELGHGGMADVFLAVIAGPVGSGFTKLTVVKRLRQNLAEEPEFVEMLVDEARISARLNHANVVQTNEVGSVGNQYFLAMEYLDGQPLHRIQHRAMQKVQRALAESPTNPPTSGDAPPSSVLLPNDPFPTDCQYLVILDTLAGLHHAHELCDYDGTPLGIVHRDVTPHNVFVTYEGQVKVVDFGIAKAAGRASETRQGVVKGKVRYMAPEQAIGQPVDRRADLFSVGIMLWEAATGRRLWKDMDDLNIVQALVGGNMKTSPREFNPDVPEAIDRICRKALAFDREERYATAEDFRADLEEYLGASGMLTSARRRLAAGVSELFKDKRAEIKGVIEKQLAKLKAQTASDVRPVSIALDSTTSSSSFAPSASSGGVAVALNAEEAAPASITDATTGLYTANTANRKKAASRGRSLAVAGALAAVVGAVALTRGAWTSAVAKPAAPATTPEAVPTDVHVSILTTPPDAQVTIDHARLWTPADTKMTRDKLEHTVRVEAAGYDPVTETVRFERDVTMKVVLKKTAPPVPSGNTAVQTGPRWIPPPPPPPKASAPPVTAVVVPPPVTVHVPAPAASPSTPPKKEKLKLDEDVYPERK